jgi:isoleucyl-tRNA synthetase
VVVLSTEITPALAAEGLARELVHAIQSRRRDLDCKYTDRIAVGLVTDSQELRDAAGQFAEYIKAETLAVELKLEPIPGAESVSIKLAGHELNLTVGVAQTK